MTLYGFESDKKHPHDFELGGPYFMTDSRKAIIRTGRKNRLGPAAAFVSFQQTAGDSRGRDSRRYNGRFNAYSAFNV
jgi:hypothetical protein